MARARHRHRSYPGGRGNRQVATALFLGLLAIALGCALIVFACSYFVLGRRNPAADTSTAGAAAKLLCPGLEIVGAHEHDRDGGTTGPSLEVARQTARAVTGSPFASFSDLSFLTDLPGLADSPGPADSKTLADCFDGLGFRYSDGDRCSVEHLLTQLDVSFGPGTFVFMDSGGAHSIAMATELGARKGYQLVFKMGSRFDPKGTDRTEQDLASYRYQHSTIAALKPEPTAPAVLIMDAHRGEKPLDDTERDNSAPFKTSQWPTAAELQASGVKRVVWILEGKTDAAPVLLDDALVAAGVFRKYEAYANNPLELLLGYRSAGLDVFRFRINPYDCPYSRRR